MAAGITGQAGAICQGIARALKEMYGLERPRPSRPTAMLSTIWPSCFATRAT